MARWSGLASTARLLGYGAVIGTVWGLAFGALFGAWYGLLIAPLATFISALTDGAAAQSGVSRALGFSLLVGLFGLFIGAIFGAVLGTMSGVVVGLALGAVTRAGFVPLGDPVRYRRVMRAVAVLCAAPIVGSAFARIPVPLLGAFPQPWAALYSVVGPALVACAAAWLASGRFAAWYIEDTSWAAYRWWVALFYAYPPYWAPPVPYSVPYPLPYPPPALPEVPLADAPAAGQGADDRAVAWDSGSAAGCGGGTR